MTRFVVTHIDRGGCRVLTFGAQARWAYETREVAEDHLRRVLANPHNDIPNIYGPQSTDTFEVREIEWYETGDPVRYALED